MAIGGKYLYDIAFRCVDYYGDIAGGKELHKEFSPNNIRRLIVSPDAVMSEFYVSVDGVGKGVIRNLPTAMYSVVSGLSDYAPLVSILSTDRVCSSVEEIIFCVNSKDGSAQLGYQEYNIDSLVTTFAQKRGTVLETVKKRFVRLHDIVVLQCNIENYRQLKAKNGNKLVSEWPEVTDNAEINFVHDEDEWWAHWGNATAAKTYTYMDAKGGVLDRYFENYIAKRREAEKKNKVDAFKKERYAEKAKEFSDEFAKFQKFLRVRKKILTISKNCNFMPDYPIDFNCFTQGALPTLYKVDEIGKYPNVKEPSSYGLGKDYDANIEMMNAYKKKLAEGSAAEYYRILASLSEMVLSAVETSLEWDIIKLPDDENASKFANVYRHEKLGMLQSYVNCCNMVCLLFLDRHCEKWDSKYITKEYWEPVNSL